MLPASTSSPPNFFTPRRLPIVSRPFEDEPPDFLCAIAYFLNSRAIWKSGYRFSERSRADPKTFKRSELRFGFLCCLLHGGLLGRLCFAGGGLRGGFLRGFRRGLGFRARRRGHGEAQ